MLDDTLSIHINKPLLPYRTIKFVRYTLECPIPRRGAMPASPPLRSRRCPGGVRTLGKLISLPRTLLIIGLGPVGTYGSVWRFIEGPFFFLGQTTHMGQWTKKINISKQRNSVEPSYRRHALVSPTMY